MANRIETITKEAHRVNRERRETGIHYPEIHDTPEQEALNALFREIGDEAREGHANHHVIDYAVTVAR